LDSRPDHNRDRNNPRFSPGKASLVSVGCDLDTATIISIYGASLSTLLGATQVVAWARNRPRIKVDARISYAPLNKSDVKGAKGTPVYVQHGDDILLEQAIVNITVVNEGALALQISAILIEELNDRIVSTKEIIAKPLPHALEPRTSITISFQKEFIDEASSITFIGVVDALGRRHAPPRERALMLIEQSWGLPTRLRKYQRRDDHTKTVFAFQARDPANLSSDKLDAGQRIPSPIASRPWPPNQQLAVLAHEEHSEIINHSLEKDGPASIEDDDPIQ
jgi:hypothetical protein